MLNTITIGGKISKIKLAENKKSMGFVLGVPHSTADGESRWTNHYVRLLGEKVVESFLKGEPKDKDNVLVIGVIDTYKGKDGKEHGVIIAEKAIKTIELIRVNEGLVNVAYVGKGYGDQPAVFTTEKLASFSVAFRYYDKDADGTRFANYRVKGFNTLAERIAKMGLTAGSKVSIKFALDGETYEDKEKQKISRDVLMLKGIEYAEKREATATPAVETAPAAVEDAPAPETDDDADFLDSIF